MEQVKQNLLTLYGEEFDLAQQSDGQAHDDAIANCIKLSDAILRIDQEENSKIEKKIRAEEEKRQFEISEQIKVDIAAEDRKERRKHAIIDWVITGVKVAIGAGVAFVGMKIDTHPEGYVFGSTKTAKQANDNLWKVIFNK